MHLSLPAKSTGARRAARGRDDLSIPRCALRDERRAIVDQAPTDSAEEPSRIAISRAPIWARNCIATRRCSLSESVGAPVTKAIARWAAANVGSMLVARSKL